jgi:hypothetical protein
VAVVHRHGGAPHRRVLSIAGTNGDDVRRRRVVDFTNRFRNQPCRIDYRRHDWAHLFLYVVVNMRGFIALLFLLCASAASAQWGGGGGTTNSVSTASNTQRQLCSIRAADFNSTADQLCVLPAAVTTYKIIEIFETNCSSSPGSAAGGVYTAASKGGTAIVAASQTFVTAQAIAPTIPNTLAANMATTRFTANPLYLSLTTPKGSAATCDMYVIGVDLT